MAHFISHQKKKKKKKQKKSLASTWLQFLQQSAYSTILESGDVFPQIYFFSYSVMATVILMNLMIAILSNVYQEVQSDVQSEFLARRVMFIASTIRVGCFQLKMWEKFVRNYILPEDKGLPGILSAPKRGVTNGLKYEEIDSFHWIFFFFFWL